MLAHGTIDNLLVTAEFQPVGRLKATRLSDGTRQIQCFGRTNWLYTLQRTADFQGWTDVTAPVEGGDSTLELNDAEAPQKDTLYRVRAERK